MIHRPILALAALTALTALTALAACGRGEPPSEVRSSDVWASREGLGADQFVLIQPGTFEMGSANGDADEAPVHTVNITKAFWLQTTEVTQGQWQAVMRTNPSHFKNCGDACPVEFVSWDDVQAFIVKLNQSNPGASYRLPTEAEWEYAARAGTTGDYGGTGVLEEMGWYRDNAEEQTHPVGQKAANAWGLYDMHGNVWEWVADWHGPYPSETVNDPTGPATGSARVMRGGSWYVGAHFAHSAVRDHYSPSYRLISFGFRLARTP